MTTNEKRPSGLDQPLTVGNALKNDRLGRNGFARQAANSLRQVTLDAGFAISVEGAWGSGKTSVLAMIEELLKSGDGPSPIIVRFNPWLVGDRDSLLRQFLTRMATAVKLSNNAKGAKKVAKEIKGYLKVFDVVKLIPGAEPWASIIKSVFEATGEAAGELGELKTLDIEEQKHKLEDALRAFSKPVIVLIDDIDRLYPQEVFEMVRIIKAVGDLPNVGYVLALEPAYVGKSLASLNVPFADTYLDKGSDFAQHDF